MIHRQTDRVTLHHGDCLDVLRELPDCSVDAVVTDPPYGLDFMGKGWDSPAKMKGHLATGTETRGAFAYGGTHDRGYADHNAAAFGEWCRLWAIEALRVLRPGGHMLAFGGTRTWHRLAVAVEDAGFEIRDSIAWMYGSGFPKSLDVSKAIDKAAGVEREVVGRRSDGVGNTERSLHKAEGFAASRDQEFDVTAPATLDAERWQGWGTALKPAFEPVVVARKPLDGTVAANVLAHGTGALNIEGCRIEGDRGSGNWAGQTSRRGYEGGWDSTTKPHLEQNALGRWPANVVLDEDQAAELDRQSGELKSGANPTRRGSDKFRDTFGTFEGQCVCAPARGADVGGASRFFYVAKASSRERPRSGDVAHPTVKPLTLMRWLVRLVTPPGGTVLEPFAGSGTTVAACLLEGFKVVAIEREADYLPLIESRIENPEPPAPERVEVVPEEQIDIFAAIGGE